MFKNILKRLRPAILLGALLLFASAFANPRITEEAVNLGADKVLHVLVFGLWATVVIRALTLIPGLPRPVLAIIVCLLTALFGLIDELLQAQNPMRVFDLWDLLADVVGGVLAVNAYLLWPAYRRFLEIPLFQVATRTRPAKISS